MDSRRPEALALVAVCVLVLRPAFRERPVAHGDAGEYLLTAESLTNHGSPELRGDDLVSLGERAREHRIEGTYGRLLRHYVPDHDRRIYGIHFWAYPLVTLPVKLVERGLGENELKAPQITNGLLFTGALAYILMGSGLAPWPRRLLALLYVTSPALPFVLWPHPEVYSYALATSSLVLRRDGRPAAATLAMALASLQNPPLALAAALMAVSAVRSSAEATDRGLAWLAFLPALLPAVSSMEHFGTPCLLARVGAAGAQNLSLRRTAELFLDPNLGMLPYVPLTLLIAVLGSVARLRGGPGRRVVAEAWGLLLLMAFACTATTNWNHGTAGPSRYVVWLLPFVFDLVVRLAESAQAPRAFGSVVLAAGLVQGAIALDRGGVHVPADYLVHSRLARVLLDHWPAFYSPDPEVFTERTAGAERPLVGPIVYRQADGRCRKALLQKRHLPEVRERCGPPRSGPDFRALVAREGRDVWAYVEY